jgi:hypothetical protein
MRGLDRVAGGSCPPPGSHTTELPATTPRGEIHWKRPSYTTLYQVLTNPIYGGAYAYGKTESAVQYVGGTARRCERRKPRERW